MNRSSVPPGNFLRIAKHFAGHPRLGWEKSQMANGTMSEQRNDDESWESCEESVSADKLVRALVLISGYLYSGVSTYETLRLASP